MKLMKCLNCGHEQSSGKFCGKCGTLLEVTSNPVVEARQAASVESVPSPAFPQPAPSTQPNEHVERVKETSKVYVSYAKEFTRHPSRIFQVTEQQFSNSIITIAILLTLASYTVYLAVKTLFGNAIGMAGVLSNMVGGVFEGVIPKIEFFPIFGKAFMFFLMLLAISVAISFVVTKLSKQQLNLKQLVSIYGTLLLPVIGIVFIGTLAILINNLVIGLALLALGFFVAVFVYPLRIAFTQFTGESKMDATHKGLIYFVGFSFVCYVIVSQYVKGIIGQIGSIMDFMDMF